MADLPDDAGRLAVDPARAGRTPRTRPTSTPRPRRAPSTACDRAIRDLGPDRDDRRRSPRRGLRGRGGAGFPAGEKWRTAAATEAPRRYVVANGYGADPAAATDRMPARAATRTRSSRVRPSPPSRSAPSEAFIAVRAEDSDAIRAPRGGDRRGRGGRLHRPRRARPRPRPRRSTVRPVQGAYMLGEETVLLKALEGKRGQPEQRPPHPAERGLFGHADRRPQRPDPRRASPWIIRNGAEAFAATGSQDEPGHDPRPASATPGRRRHRRGPARHAAARDRRRSAASSRPAARSRPSSSAGPSGGLLPPELLDTPYDFDALRAAGAHVGSGSVVVADDRACIVDLARLLTRFCAERGLRQDDPLPDRDAPARRDRRPRHRWPSPEPDRPRPARPTCRPTSSASALCDHERLTTLPLHERDAILPVRARRPPPAQCLPCRRLPPDRGGSRRDRMKATHG